MTTNIDNIIFAHNINELRIENVEYEQIEELQRFDKNIRTFVHTCKQRHCHLRIDNTHMAECILFVFFFCSSKRSFCLQNVKRPLIFASLVAHWTVRCQCLHTHITTKYIHFDQKITTTQNYRFLLLFFSYDVTKDKLNIMSLLSVTQREAEYVLSLSIECVCHTKQLYALYRRRYHQIQSIFLLRVFVEHIQQTVSLLLLFFYYFILSFMYVYMEGIYCARIEISTIVANEKQSKQMPSARFFHPVWICDILSQSVSDFISEFTQQTNEVALGKVFVLFRSLSIASTRQK